MKRPVTADDAMMRMAALCARSEQATADIVKKLTAFQLPAGEIRKIIDRLKELKFLDDERYARAFAHDRLEFACWGRRKISQGLWAKKIPADVIRTVLEDIDEEIYLDRAAAAVRSKMRSLGSEALTREGRMKILRFAMSRGFEGNLVSKVIREIVSREQFD